MAGDGRVWLRKHHFLGVLAWWPGSAGISSVVANNMAICRPTFGGGISHHQMWVHPRPLWITMVSSDETQARFGLAPVPPFGPFFFRLNLGSALHHPPSALISPPSALLSF